MQRIHKLLIAIIVLILSIPCLHAQVTGLWKTIDDRDGSEKSVIEIFEQNGKLNGKVVRLLTGATYTTCGNCQGDLKDMPIVGMTILYDLTKTETGGIDGTVLDPNNGKTYSCYVVLENSDKLKLRGYIGIPALGRTQYWYRVK